MSLVGCASFTLNLHGRVRDLEFRRHLLLDCRKDFVMQSVVGEDCVDAHCIHSRGKRPNVQIMKVGNPRNALDRFPQSRQVNVGGRTFKQHADCIPQQDPSARENEESNACGDERIGVVPASS